MNARAALAASLLSIATAAHAVTIDSAGDAFTVQFDGNIETETVAGLTASASFLVTEFDSAAGRAVVQIALSNASDAALWQGTRVSAIGFDVDADLAGASASGLFAQVVTGGKFPNQFGPVDVCAVDNPNNCSGGQNGGVTLGNSGVVALTLHFESGLPSLALGHFGVRYQSLDSKALGFCDASGTGGGTVPEPSLLGLLGAAGLALYGRRRSA